LRQLVTALVLPGLRQSSAILAQRSGALFGLAAIALGVRALLVIFLLRPHAVVLLADNARHLGRRLGDQWFAHLGDRRLAIPQEGQREGYCDQDQYQKRRRAHVYEVAPAGTDAALTSSSSSVISWLLA
jgi:hypothetical protein